EVERHLALAAPDRPRQQRPDRDQRHEPDWQVDGEARAPADVVGQHAADQRPGDERDAHHPGHRALQRGAAAAGVEAGDQDERQRRERARPAPWIARDPTSQPIDGATPASALPHRNRAMPTNNRSRRPNRSDSRAYSGSVTVAGTRY